MVRWQMVVGKALSANAHFKDVEGVLLIQDFRFNVSGMSMSGGEVVVVDLGERGLPAGGICASQGTFSSLFCLLRL